MNIHETQQENASEFLAPWEAVSEASAIALLRELALELAETHPLFEIKLGVVARSGAADDVLFLLPDGRFVQVHLTWVRRKERLPYPVHHVYENFADWAEAVMLPEHDGYD